ncbi:hypothetical protein FNV43_RR01311 [Rhamnella rubrinervis]|uniref:Uncharacterized protein n=1 Tax=Rhamnella rubrinervis TaxID=2594499 RepID=A0A8K0HPL3_9ROSA|nr:hypothetical protein FNV43_RR01311 [Rhamnella rubrinervis]
MFNLIDSSKAFLLEEKACREGNDPKFQDSYNADDFEEEEVRFVDCLFRGGGEQFARREEERRSDCGLEKEEEEGVH